MVDSVSAVSPATTQVKGSSKAKKAAIVAGAVTGALAIGATAYALSKGKKVEGADTFIKQAKEGYKVLGADIASVAAKAKNKAVELFAAAKEKVSAFAHKGKDTVEEVAQEVTQDAADAADAVL